MEHRAEGSDARAGGDEDRIAHRWPQNKIAEGSLTPNLLAFFHIAQKVGHEAVLHAIEAEREAGILSWRGGNRVSAREFLSLGLDLLERQPLTRHEPKAPRADHFELQVFCEFR